MVRKISINLGLPIKRKPLKENPLKKLIKQPEREWPPSSCFRDAIFKDAILH
jgi:hypothetical protein